jgi:hypothetical protein
LFKTIDDLVFKRSTTIAFYNQSIMSIKYNNRIVEGGHVKCVGICILIAYDRIVIVQKSFDIKVSKLLLHHPLQFLYPKRKIGGEI